MDDTLLWLSQFRHLINDLQRCWDGDCPESFAGQVIREDHKVNTFVYGYPTFLGKRGEHRVSVTIDYFHHAATSRLAPDEHVEILCLTLKKPQQGFISFRDFQWFDKTLARSSTDWKVQTGNARIDKQFFVEARSEQNKELVSLHEYQSHVEGLMPFSSLAFRDTGIHWSAPIESGAQLSVANVDKTWNDLAAISRLCEIG